MKEIDRTIGVLEEQGRWNAKEIMEIKCDLKEMKSDIKSLLFFRWKIFGSTAILSVLATLFVEWIRK